ncbi:MAG: hypothetical protein DYH12_15455 [Sorangiineae bacterium PRO1]|nr:hypothetical protein [Sorangiineae bacterium PRO1]
MCCGVSFLIFAQAPEPRVDPAALVRNATRHFRADVEILEEGAGTLRLKLGDASFALHARPRSEADLQRARQAETRGRAAGMADLAARCPTVWEVEPEPGTAEGALHRLCAVLAITALGPVLPPDDSTLYGVRGALERAQKA